MSDRTYPLGKLPAHDLERLLARYASPVDPRLIQGPGLGRDAAVIDWGERYLVTKSDPITFATDAIGWYAVHVNANDIACLGATPRWFVATLLLPEKGATPELVESLFAQLAEACAGLHVLLIGGHTEVTAGLDRPLVIGTMLGEVTPEALVRSDGAQVGDVLLLTKGIAVEGTALLARESYGRLRDQVDAALLARVRTWLHQPGISVVRDAQIATQAGRVHAMHDITEGGFATGIRELVGAAGRGTCLNSPLPVLPETQTLCAACGLDPLGLIASGALLLAVAPEDAPAIQAALRAADIAVWAIGTVTAEPDVRYADGRPLPTFARDEIARWFEELA